MKLVTGKLYRTLNVKRERVTIRDFLPLKKVAPFRKNKYAFSHP